MRTWLIDLREKHNLTQADVAKKLNVTQGYYCLIEKGERQADLNLSIAEKLSKMFNISLKKISDFEKSLKS